MIHSRIAPTPSGYLHIGNAFNFVLTWLRLRSEGGILRLRIDDCDTPRAQPEHMEDIFRTLDWMGMDWDLGPRSAEEEMQIYAQSLRMTRYEEMIRRLTGTGHVFACSCSRRELQMRPCDCRQKALPLDQPDTALRVSTPATPILVNDHDGDHHILLDRDMKDFVIRRRDGIPAYQLVSLTDDIDHHIDLIVRGADLLPSTSAQLYLASLIGEEAFMKVSFYHHALIQDERGAKLSKSAGSSSLKAMRESGMTREQLYIKISGLLGLHQPASSLDELLQRDDWAENLSRST